MLLCSGGAAAVFALRELHTLRQDLSINPGLDTGSALAPVGYGAPETFLLVGNDQRKKTTTVPVLPHDNENLLVRFDPGKPYISMMSIPRELQATINCPQGAVTTRLNYSLTCGGISTMVRTIKQLTGLSVNHVLEVNFGQFKQAINDIGCVYSTIDRRYYHMNVPGGEQYQEINLQPGYQKMCGGNALSFVSYRHGDTSLVRDARDQSLLLDVKKEYGPTLVDSIHKFEKIFGQSVNVDRGLQSTSGILNLLGTLISSSSLRVRTVQFQVTLQPTGANSCSCDTATQQQIAASVNAFLYGGSGLPPKRSVAAVANAVHRKKGAPPLPLVPLGSQTLTKAVDAAADIPFALEIPRVQDRGGSVNPVQVRNYSIEAPDGTSYPAYVAVFSAAGLGQYYDVQGTTWTTPPLLDSPDQTIQVGGRTYYLFYEGQHLDVVAWYEHHAAYWVRNTLSQSVGNGELLAIAEQTSPATSHVGHPVTLGSAAVPERTVEQATNNLEQTLGSLGGLIALATLPLLVVPLFRRRREIAKLRLQLAATLQFESRLASLAPAARTAAPPTAAGRGGATHRRPGRGGATHRRPGRGGATHRREIVVRGTVDAACLQRCKAAAADAARCGCRCVGAGRAGWCGNCHQRGGRTVGSARQTTRGPNGSLRARGGPQRHAHARRRRPARPPASAPRREDRGRRQSVRVTATRAPDPLRAGRTRTSECRRTDARRSAADGRAHRPGGAGRGREQHQARSGGCLTVLRLL